MPSRNFSANKYRFGFNGKENSYEIGSGDFDFGARMYDSKIGKFLSLDRLMNKTPFYSPYIYAGNKPVVAIDQDGDLEIIIHIKETYHNPITKKITTTTKTTRLKVETFEDLKNINRTPVEVTITYVNNPKERKVGNMYFYEDNRALVGISDNSNTGLTLKEEEKTTNAFGYYMNIAMYDLSKTIGAYQYTQAAVGKDLESGEDMTSVDRAFNLASGIISNLTLGRATFKNEMTKWTKDQLMDMGAEKIITYAFEKAGFKGKELAILGYFVTRAVIDMKKGEFKKLSDALLKAGELGTKGRESILKFLKESYGVDTNMPQNRNQGLAKALSDYLMNSSSQDKKVLNKFVNSHQ